MAEDSTFLSVVEMIALTGYRHSSAQARALNRMGIEHKIRPDGKVVVLREHIKEMLCKNTSMSSTIRKTQPNWGQFDKGTK